jgi:VCBS repeat protein/FG-GAP repeat protein
VSIAPQSRLTGDAGRAVATLGALLVLLLALGLWGARSARAVSFAPESHYSVGGSPWEVAVADFDGDDDPDLAVSNSTLPGKVMILLGEVGGTFGAPTPYGVGKAARGVAVADFDRDGIGDLAVTNELSGSVSVLFGRGDGTFRSQVQYPVGTDDPRLRPVVVADFDGDGDGDLAVADNRYSNVWVLLGAGDGSFGAPTSYPVRRGPTQIATGDFNDDGDPDLVTNNGSVLLGASGGTFGTATNIGTGGQIPQSVAVGDFNLDGDPDLAFANAFENVSVRLGAAGATFSAPTAYPNDENPWAVGIGDLNFDGDQDLAVGNFYGGDVSILLGGAGGTFAAQTTTFPVNGGPSSVVLADFDQDGDQDVVDSDWFSGPSTVSVLLNTAVVLAPTSITYKSRPDHTDSERKPVTLTNNAAPALTISSVTVIATDASSFVADPGTCKGATLAAGQSCTAMVRFRPLGTGLKTASLRVSDSLPGSAPTVALSGTGTPGPWLSTSVQGLKFGSVPVGTTSVNKSVTLKNVGSANMTISAITVGGTNPGDFTGLTHNCASLAPGQSCSAQIASAPPPPARAPQS